MNGYPSQMLQGNSLPHSGIEHRVFCTQHLATQVYVRTTSTYIWKPIVAHFLISANKEF